MSEALLRALSEWNTFADESEAIEMLTGFDEVDRTLIIEIARNLGTSFVEGGVVRVRKSKKPHSTVTCSSSTLVALITASMMAGAALGVLVQQTREEMIL